MNLEALKAEAQRAEEAALESDEQLRKLPDLIDKSTQAGALVKAVDCAKTVAAALALNERLRERANRLAKEVSLAEPPALGAHVRR